MAEPTFSQAERRSFVVPILLALAALGVALLLARHFFPATSVQSAYLETKLLPTVTEYKADSIVVGQNEKIYTLWVASTVRVDNKLRVPVSLDDYSLTFTANDGGEMEARALTHDEMANAQVSFPALKPLLTHPLLRDVAIEPGQSAEGTLLFSLALPKEYWETRKSAMIKVSLYHLSPEYIPVPR